MTSVLKSAAYTRSVSTESSSFSDQELHRLRQVAESFGVDAARYDRARPRYPDALIQRVIAASPGVEFLDVGCGTGIGARQYRAAGCTVLGVDVDERMAEVARQSGVEVELGKFEDWDARGRSFDAVVAGQAWHWVDPRRGPVRAAAVLSPGVPYLRRYRLLQAMPEGLRPAFPEPPVGMG